MHPRPLEPVGPIAMVCRDCRCPFVIDSREAGFYAARDFSLPTRCPGCRAARRADGADRQRRIRHFARDHRVSERAAEDALFGD